MSCAKAEEGAGCFDVSSPAQLQAEVTFEEIAEGLHALAQPLSGLRSAVELMNMLPAEEGKRYRQMCAAEIERACEMFGCLQGLVSASTSEPKPGSFDCRELVRTLAAERGLTERFPKGFFDEAGSRSLAAVKGDPARTRQAFTSLLTVLARVCGSAGPIEASCERGDDLLVFRFKAGDDAGQRLNSANRLHLSLARANIVSQGGGWQVKPDTLAIWVALPLA
jgi:hypothetical protein